jgi:hypothetical protein
MFLNELIGAQRPYFWQWRQKVVMRWAAVISVSGLPHEGVGQG